MARKDLVIVGILANGDKTRDINIQFQPSFHFKTAQNNDNSQRAPNTRLFKIELFDSKLGRK